MPSPLVQFRAVPPLDTALAARQRHKGAALGSIAQDCLARYFAMLLAELATVELTRDQALALCDILNGTLTTDPLWLDNPGRLLSFEVEDSAPDGVGEKWGVDLDKLAATCRSWRRGQALAVIDAVDRWWAGDDNDSDLDASLAAVGLVKQEARPAG